MASGSEVNSYRKGRLNELSKIMSDRLNDFLGKYARVYMAGGSGPVIAAKRLRDFYTDEKFTGVGALALYIALEAGANWADRITALFQQFAPLEKYIQDYLDAVRKDYGSDPIQ